MDVIGFLKQRRRWYVGIRRLPQLLPKIWAGFWTLGTLSLYGTVAAVVVGFFYPMGTPRWFGFLKDFSFVTFIHLYLWGIVVQDIDAGVHPLLILLHIPLTIIVQFIAVALESAAIVYAILEWVVVCAGVGVRAFGFDVLIPRAPTSASSLPLPPRRSPPRDFDIIKK